MAVLLNQNMFRTGTLRPQFVATHKVVRKGAVVVRAQLNENEPFAQVPNSATEQEKKYQSQIDNAGDEVTKRMVKREIEELKNGRELSQAAYESFRFDGIPEDVNGRMCMLAFTLGIIKEFTTGQSISQQSMTTPFGTWLIFFAFIVASIIPSVRKANRKDFEFGPFTEPAEVFNGRSAMIGFVSVLIVEAIAHRPLLEAIGIIQ